MELGRATISLSSGVTVCTSELRTRIDIVSIYLDGIVSLVVGKGDQLLVTSILVMPQSDSPQLESRHLGRLVAKRNRVTEVFAAPVASLMNRYRARLQSNSDAFPPTLISPIEIDDDCEISLNYYAGSDSGAWIYVEVQMLIGGYVPEFK